MLIQHRRNASSQTELNIFVDRKAQVNECDLQDSTDNQFEQHDCFYCGFTIISECKTKEHIAIVLAHTIQVSSKSARVNTKFFLTSRTLIHLPNSFQLISSLGTFHSQLGFLQITLIQASGSIFWSVNSVAGKQAVEQN